MVFVSKSGDVAEYRSGTGHRPDSENNGMNSLKRSITDSESSANRKSKVQYIHVHVHVHVCKPEIVGSNPAQGSSTFFEISCLP